MKGLDDGVHQQTQQTFGSMKDMRAVHDEHIDQLSSTTSENLNEVVSKNDSFSEENLASCNQASSLHTTTSEMLVANGNNLDAQLSAFGDTAMKEFEATTAEMTNASTKLVTQIRTGFKGV